MDSGLLILLFPVYVLVAAFFIIFAGTWPIYKYCRDREIIREVTITHDMGEKPFVDCLDDLSIEHLSDNEIKIVYRSNHDFYLTLHSWACENRRYLEFKVENNKATLLKDYTLVHSEPKLRHPH